MFLDPTGSYNIDLTNPLERAVLLDALDAVAMHQSFAIQDFEYECVEGSEYWENISLFKIDELRLVEHFDSNEHAELDSLVKLLQILTEAQFLDKLKSSFIVSFIDICSIIVSMNYFCHLINIITCDFITD